jgi:NitT/TauT family transport system substrate-binding protein
MTIVRRFLFQAFAATFALSTVVLSGQCVSAQETIKVRMDYFPYALHAPFHYAVAQGWYKEQGLDVKIDDGNGSVNTVQLVGEGSYDFGFANLSTMAKGKARGVNVIAVGEVLHRLDVGLLVDKKLGIKTPKELVDKKVQVVVLNAGFMGTFMNLYFKAAGTDVSQVNILNVNDEAAAYMAGTGGAVFTTIPYAAPVAARARPSDIFWAADIGLDMPAFGIIANGDLVKKNPDEVRKFMAVTSRAFRQAWEGSGKEMIDALVAARPQGKINPQDELVRLEAYRPLGKPDSGKPTLYLSPVLWDKFFKTMIGDNQLPANAVPTDYYTNEFLPPP